MSEVSAPDPAELRIPRRELADYLFRAFVFLVTCLALPHFAWVWAADRRLAAVEQRADAAAAAIVRIEALAESTREKGQEQAANLQLMQRDLTYLREGIDDLRDRLPARTR